MPVSSTLLTVYINMYSIIFLRGVVDKVETTSMFEKRMGLNRLRTRDVNLEQSFVLTRAQLRSVHTPW